MCADKAWLSLENRESAAKGGIALVGRRVEPVVCSQLPRHLPDRLHGIELGGVRRQAVQLNAISIRGEPLLSLRRQVVTGCVVDD